MHPDVTVTGRSGRRPVAPRWMIALLATVWIVAGCASRPPAANPTDLFARIQAGMSRSELETLLGPPRVPPPVTQCHGLVSAVASP